VSALSKVKWKKYTSLG